MRSVIQAKGLTVTFAGVDVLCRVDVTLNAGEIHAIVGENGAGKSSLAKALAGVYRSREGEILLDQMPVTFQGPRQALEKGIALIHQEPLNFPDLSVAENIFAGHHPTIRGAVNWREVQAKAKAILSDLRLDLDPRQSVSGLSIAQQQLVELASAMSHRARVWIFDETTASLTPKEAEELFRIMRDLKSRGCAVAMVTHHLNEVIAVSDRVTVLRDGEKVAEGATSDFTVERIVHAMVGRELQIDKFRNVNLNKSDPMLEVEGLVGQGFGPVSLTVNRGEVVGLAGLVGAGRSEIVRGLVGITMPRKGQVRLRGVHPTAKLKGVRSAMQQGMVLVPEDRRKHGLLFGHPISFNLTLPTLIKWSKRGYLRDRELAKPSKDMKAALAIRCQGIDQAVDTLSGGNQQKVVLGKWLLANPDILILDEPTRGVDVGAKHEVHRLIREQAAAGKAILVVSSDLPELLAITDRILVVRKGLIVRKLDTLHTNQEEIMRWAA